MELPEGWEWGIYQDGDETIDKSTALELGVPVKAVAVYNGADKGNYVTERVEITITRLACDHEESEILYTGIGEHAPDCVNSGLGHTECTKCHEVMRDGISVPELGHNYESEVTTAPTTTSTGVRTYTCKNCGDSYTEIIAKLREEAKEPTVGKKYKDDKGKAYYTVTSNAKNAKTVTYSAPVNKKVTSVTIPATVKICGVSYKVTAIKKNAFKNCKKLTKVTIGSNIRSIGANAFYGCKKLKTLTVKTTKLTSKKVGKKAFNKTPKSMTVKVPKKMLGKYKKLFVNKGVSKKAKFKKL